MEEEKHVNNSFGGGDGFNYKVKTMCSYGGKIQPRASDHQLTYVGGDIKILTVDRNIMLSNLISKIHSLCNSNSSFRLKYQLPGYDFYTLVSVIDETDLENMMYEYDRNSTEPARFRIFVFFSDVKPPKTPDFLFGFDKEYTIASSTAAATSTNTKPEIPSAEDVDSYSRTENQKTNQIEAQNMGVMAPDAYSRDNNVIPGGARLFYLRISAPAATGYYEVMHREVGSWREQPPVYIVPVFPFGKEQVSLTIGHATEGLATVAAGGDVGSMQPRTVAAAAAVSNHETTKVSPES